jgi:hypothetical protein
MMVYEIKFDNLQVCNYSLSGVLIATVNQIVIKLMKLFQLIFFHCIEL